MIAIGAAGGSDGGSYEPCEPQPLYLKALSAPFPERQLLREQAAADLTGAKQLLDDRIRERAEFPVLSVGNRVARAEWARSFSKAVKDVSLKRLEVRQLHLLEGESAAAASIISNGCHPAGQAEWRMPSAPPRWSAQALAVPDLMTRSVFWKQCAVRLACDKHRNRGRSRRARGEGNLGGEANEGEEHEAALRSHVEAFLRHPHRSPSICVSNRPPACAINAIQGFFDALSAKQQQQEQRHRRRRHHRIFTLGSDEALPAVPGRDGVGLPINFRRTPPSDAFADLAAWDERERTVATDVDGERQRPVKGHAALLRDLEQRKGLNFTWFAANLIARHPRLAPLPIGVNGPLRVGAGSLPAAEVLRKVRQELRSAPVPKRRLLLMNFKGSGSFQGSSEREALYKAAGLGWGRANASSSSSSSSSSLSSSSRRTAGVGMGVGVGVGQDALAATVAKGDGDDNNDDDDNGHAFLLASVEPRFLAAWEDGDQRSFYRHLAGFHFALAPRGNGLDTFRTWEALALGVVPVVKKSGPFDSVYQGLPVLLVDRWSDVTFDLLRTTAEDWRERPFDLRKLSWRYWQAQGD